MALGLVGLTLYAVGILGTPVWIGVTAGLYAIGYLLAPVAARVDVRHEAATDPTDIRDRLNSLMHGIRGKVADDLYAKAWSIRESIFRTLEVEREGNEADPNVYLIRQTALSYLPEAFATYLRLPRVVAERRSIANGRTPHDVLLEQLDLMDGRLEKVADDIARSDSDALMANGRFLAEKFGSSAFQLPPETATTAAEEVPAVDLSQETVAAEQPAEAELVDERERVH